MSQVPVYHQYFFPFNGKARGYVHRKETLSTTRIERGNHKYFLIGILVFHKVHVGAKYTKSFVDDVAIAFFHHDCFFLRFVLLFLVIGI